MSEMWLLSRGLSVRAVVGYVYFASATGMVICGFKNSDDIHNLSEWLLWTTISFGSWFVWFVISLLHMVRIAVSGTDYLRTGVLDSAVAVVLCGLASMSLGWMGVTVDMREMLSLIYCAPLLACLAGSAIALLRG